MEPEQHLDVVMDTEAPQSCMTQARVPALDGSLQQVGAISNPIVNVSNLNARMITCCNVISVNPRQAKKWTNMQTMSTVPESNLVVLQSSSQ